METVDSSVRRIREGGGLDCGEEDIRKTVMHEKYVELRFRVFGEA